MARDGFRILDCDLHVMEPPDLWQRYTDAKFRHLAPVGLLANGRDLRTAHPDGRPWGMPDIRFDLLATGKAFVEGSKRYEPYAQRGWSAQTQLEAMDAEGIDVAILYPSRGLHTLAEPNMEPRLAAALARAYNDWLYDFCQQDPRRMIGVGMISPFDMDDAVAEARRCVRELGFRGVFLRSNIVTGRPWSDRSYDPLWAALVELDVPVGFHEAATSGAPQVGDQFGFDFGLRHAYAFPLEQMMAIGQLTWGGVCARFPQLRIAFLEGNCGWLPWMLWRLDERWELLGDVFSKDTTMKPSQYFKRQCWVSVDCEEESVKYAVDYFGKSDNIIFSTDYPHVDAQFPKSSAKFLELPLSDEDKRKILWDNCAAFYHAAVPA
jgi:predicted TIM-barrel fold metal-dependent hydrolase